eukprot:COSAG06_NODE_25413_length_637_cov_1.823420_1_plen_41_part_01
MTRPRVSQSAQLPSHSHLPGVVCAMRLVLLANRYVYHIRGV